VSDGDCRNDHPILNHSLADRKHREPAGSNCVSPERAANKASSDHFQPCSAAIIDLIDTCPKMGVACDSKLQRHFASSTLSQKCHIHTMVSHNNPWPSCGGSTSTTQSEFTPGCSVRALARAGVPRPPYRRLITCARRATGLASKRGKRSPLN
jgi:hypothetical protein